jgi:antitoxin component of RelBE/YafQ-DinJ toxin-antitoxin module
MRAQETEEFRVRIDPKILKETKRVADNLGTTPGEIVRMLFAQVVKLGGLPFRPSEYPALDEYGVTVTQAEAALIPVSKELDAEFKSGKMVEFKGKLPSP